uniref:Peptidase S1 domain-containing protein n=1 Tax=Clastoptera arizonana TaxID=38151 RepID=A0A1B6D7L6_9HEMI
MHKWDKFIVFILLIIIKAFTHSVLSKPDFCVEDNIKGAGILAIHEKYSDHKYLVYIAYWDSDQTGFTYCTGVLVTLSYVITTAECLRKVRCERSSSRKFKCGYAEGSLFDVIAGRTFLITSGEETQIRKGSEIFIHPDYQPNDLTYNFGILKLQSEFKESELVAERKIRKSSRKMPFYLDSDTDFCTMHFFNKNPCSSKFTKLVRENMYTFTTGGNYGSILSVKVRANDVEARNEKICEKMFDKYEELGYTLDKNMLVCARTAASDYNCRDISEAVVFCSYVPVGFLVKPITCYYGKHPLLFVQFEKLDEWIHSITYN